MYQNPEEIDTRFQCNPWEFAEISILSQIQNNGGEEQPVMQVMLFSLFSVSYIC
jgi:hypothetical protein